MATVTPFFTWRRAMTCSDLPSTTKLVLFVVAEYANAVDDIVWPSIESLAERASLSERAVAKHLAIAERDGWLARWKSRRPNRKWAHSHYRFSIPEAVAKQQRDAINLDLAAASNADEILNKDERRSTRAQEVGGSEPRAGNCGELNEPCAGNSGTSTERGAGDLVGTVSHAPNSESYLHHVPTKYPVNGDCIKPSLSQPTVVNEATGVQREDHDESSLSIARWMFERLQADDPGIAKPDMEAWAREVDAMIVLDGRATDAMGKLFGYARRDRFWAKVITSPARLRKNWDELRVRRNGSIAAKHGKASTQPTASAPDDRVCAHVENGCRCTHAASTIIGAGSARRGYCRQHIGHYED
ncbi:helix-turn-helix domain-containing protein [Paraburkholderia sp. SEWSISQ10-3 4]|uniref:helix-turn-helix domain-containing protein n=1 Tax=Paraburkholderia TaxID=1822464 RepID=UPI00225A88B3|nr:MULTISPECIES: helix-turn-helix domain-containing protein [Paraburkholderia]MCX4139377.1 helix-turn-helix domain-containing protein [Paraburkholderia aspalathi]MDN7172065.1 helix-turn-helix domain-containing protein [Paraburkholderia sp. SEWSISQ10-3 4]MDQ6501704.1 helix-turn-helix domain-containing protein [Paraburkholderia aspalathi]